MASVLCALHYSSFKMSHYCYSASFVLTAIPHFKGSIAGILQHKANTSSLTRPSSRSLTVCLLVLYTVAAISTWVVVCACMCTVSVALHFCLLPRLGACGQEVEVGEQIWEFQYICISMATMKESIKSINDAECSSRGHLELQS